MKKKTIKVDYIARVEGEGALYIKIGEQGVEDVQLKIFEPPRFFESLLRGRSFREAPDITARICGICPVAYMMSSVHAIEKAVGLELDPEIRALRRLFYCAEWIESHVLHMVMLHAPDFLNYHDAVSMAKEHPQYVKSALKIKKLGNEIVSIIGGRSVHPINVRVGGFYKLPEAKDFAVIKAELLTLIEEAEELLRWVSAFDFPDFDVDYEYVSLRHESEYPFNEGRIVSNRGLDIDASEFEQNFHEHHVKRSNALHCYLRKNDSYLVGPMARFHNNFDQLSPRARQAAEEQGLSQNCFNPFRGIQVRGVELIYALDEAWRIIDHYQKPEKAFRELDARGVSGCAVTEAPRGILYHRYEIDDEGQISFAKIVPPTSQNQRMIELDLEALVTRYIDLDDEQLQWRCEQAIRNYDPCISCATHFLKLDVERG